MKFGVISTRVTANIGDDIQSLAAIELLRQNGINEYVCVEREALNSYSGEPVALIMNGWFLHYMKNFPPSDKIKPLFISFHCEKEELIKKHQKYFQKHEPIGCRSNSTVHMCHKYGIKAYLSGCLTLCFDETDKNLKRQDRTYVVDVKLKDSHENSIHITHIHETLNGQTNQQRFWRAQALLDLYREAELVITCRLHCLLPCRAFNTNTKFVHRDYASDPRFKGLEDIINGETGYYQRFKHSVLGMPDIVGLPMSQLDKVPNKVNREIIDNKKNELKKAFTELLGKNL